VIVRLGRAHSTFAALVIVVITALSSRASVGGLRGVGPGRALGTHVAVLRVVAAAVSRSAGIGVRALWGMGRGPVAIIAIAALFAITCGARVRWLSRGHRARNRDG
jgi:hypothetical protein